MSQTCIMMSKTCMMMSQTGVMLSVSCDITDRFDVTDIFDEVTDSCDYVISSIYLLTLITTMDDPWLPGKTKHLLLITALYWSPEVRACVILPRNYLPLYNEPNYENWKLC